MDDVASFTETPIGLVPSHWTVAKLEEVSDERVERNDGASLDRSFVMTVTNNEGLVPSDRKLGNDLTRYKLVTLNCFAYNPMRLNVGSIALWPEDVRRLVSPDYVVFQCREERLIPQFLDFFRRTLRWRNQIAMSGQGSVRIRYYYRHIAEFIIPLPPLPEQKAIARILSAVQEAKEKTEAVIQAAKELKKSLMKHLFTYGPVPLEEAERVPLRESEIGNVPEECELAELTEIANLLSGGTPSKTRREWWNGPIPWVSPKDLKETRLYESSDHVSAEGLKNGSRLAPAHSIFVVVRGMILAKKFPVTMAMQPMAFNQDIKAIVPTANVGPDYLLYCLQRFSKQLLPEIGTSAHGTKRIGTHTLEKFRVPLPRCEIQNEVVSILNSVDQKITAEENRKKALDELFKTLLENLMTGKIRVQVPEEVAV